jgi:hypothetical protein
MPWRVQGAACRKCGLVAAQEIVPIEFQRSGVLGFAQDAAPGRFLTTAKEGD